MPGPGVLVGARRRRRRIPAPGPADVIVLIGDSNARGTQSDPQNVTYAVDPQTFAWNGTDWGPYAPNLNPAFMPATGRTGLHFGTAEGRWALELQIAKQFRAAQPDRALFIFKYAASGSMAMYDSAATGGNPFLAWDGASGGALESAARTQFNLAWNAIVAAGYTPTLRLIDINLGANDAAFASVAAGFQSAMTNLVAALRSGWHLTGGATRIVLNRPPLAGAGANVATVRAAVAAVAEAASDCFWVNLDGSTHNGGGDAIHFSAAGQIANGNAVWAEYVSPENALILALGPDLLAWWDAGFGVTLSGSTVSAWRDRIGGLSPAQAATANQPGWAANDFTGGGPSLTFDGVNDTLTLGTGLASLPTGSAASWIWGLATQTALPTDAASRTLIAWGGNVAAPSTERRLRRAVLAGVNRAQMLTGIGGGLNVNISETSTDLSGRRLLLAKVEANLTEIGVDAGAMASIPGVPSTGNGGTTLTQLTLGSGPATQYWQGKVRDLLITRPLDATKEAALRSFLTARM